MSVLLEVMDLTKSYGEKQVVQNIQFYVKKGEILGFLGPNGAGKSTTIKMLIDVEPKDNGEILFQGQKIGKGSIANLNMKDMKDMKGRKEMTAFKKSIGVVPQEIAIYEDISAYNNVKFFCSLYGFRGKELKDRVKEALDFVGLWERSKELPTKFSGGMKRRLNIACSIAHSPKLLIMDEPTVGIDPQSRYHIMEAIKTLNSRGTTVIYVSHYMEEIETICNRVIIMDHGNIIEDIEMESLKNKYKEQQLNTLEEIFLHLTGTELRDGEV